MNKKATFIDLTEPRTLVAALIPVIYSLLFSIYQFHTINAFSFAFFVVVNILMQMSVNIWNNIQDYRHNDSAWEKNSVNNSIQNGQESLRFSYQSLFVLLGVAFVLGLFTAFTSDNTIYVLSIGFLGGLIGFLYAGTKKPISNSPFGEIASGVGMGFLIFLAGVFINVSHLIAQTSIWQIVLISIMPTIGIANIMLSNNLSDHKEDEAAHRHTLVHYLGVAKSLVLFESLYIIGYLSIVAAVFLDTLPWETLLVFITLPLQIRNFRIFSKKQSKKETFTLAIMNIVIIHLALFIGLLLGILV